MRHRCLSLLSNTWASTAASTWIQCTSGASYCYGVYSSLLKSSQSYSQSTLSSVAFFKDAGANIGVLSGLLYSHTSTSPWIVIAAGSLQCFIGYFMIWLSVTGKVGTPPVALMCLYMFLAAHSQTFFNTADVVTAVQNFPLSRGTAVGIMKSQSKLRSKWSSSIASIWIQCTSGSSYCFGMYSPILKSSQFYSQSTLDSVAFCKDIGANVGVLSGLLYFHTSPPPSSSDHVRQRQRRRRRWKGVWVVLAVGSVQCFVGYFMIWASVTGLLGNPPVPLMCFYMFLAAHAMTFFNTADVVTALRNFPENRGTAVGIMKGFLGLSGAILIKVYQTIYAGEPSHFILVLALLPSILPLVLMFLVNVYPDGGEDDARYLNGFSIISLLVAAYLMVLIIWENLVPIKTAVRVITFVVLLLLLASPLWILVKAQGKESSTTVKPISHERIRLLDDTDLLESQEHERHESRETDIPSDPQNREDLNILQAMSTTNFWLLFISMACGMGSGLATVNNISQIGDSLGYTSVEISTLVSLWSIWNFLGRFGAGYTSDFFQTTRGFARPLFIAITIATMSVGLLVIASGFPGALYLGSVLVGVCYGCQWSLMPTITSELFGVMHMGTIFNTISIASPLGSYVLSVRLVGYVYDMEASSSGTKTCSGVHCFRLSFLIMASVSLLGFVTSLILLFRTRKFYEQVVIKKVCHDSSVNHKDQSSFFEPE